MDITSLLNTSTDARDELCWSSRGDFAFLFANGIVWLITALPMKVGGWSYPKGGAEECGRSQRF